MPAGSPKRKGGRRVAMERDLARLQTAEALIAMQRVNEIPPLLVNEERPCSWRTEALIHPLAHRRRWVEILDAMADEISEQLGKDGKGEPDETLVTVTARLLQQLSEKRLIYTEEQEEILRDAMAPFNRYRARHSERLPRPTTEDLFSAADILCRYGLFEWATTILGHFDDKLTVNGRTLPYDHPYRLKAREQLAEVERQKALRGEEQQDWLGALANRRVDVAPAGLPLLAATDEQSAPEPPEPSAQRVPRCPRPPRALEQPARNAGEFFAGLGITWDSDETAVAP